MATVESVVNTALRRIGAQPITAIGAATPNAEKANAIYEEERDALLRAHVWNFAVARAELTRLVTLPAFEWDYAYAKPADWLRTVSVHDNDAGDGAVAYKEESINDAGTWKACILCGAEEVWLRYVRQVTDVNLMTPHFREAWSLRMAKILAIAIANSNTLMQQIGEEYKQAIRAARSIDGIEDYPEALPAGSWHDARWGDQ